MIFLLLTIIRIDRWVDRVQVPAGVQPGSSKSGEHRLRHHPARQSRQAQLPTARSHLERLQNFPHKSCKCRSHGNFAVDCGYLNILNKIDYDIFHITKSRNETFHYSWQLKLGPQIMLYGKKSTHVFNLAIKLIVNCNPLSWINPNKIGNWI